MGKSSGLRDFLDLERVSAMDSSITPMLKKAPIYRASLISGLDIV
jgi:hypothetical protein